MTRKFWNWVRNEEPDSFGSDRTLYLDGEISDETWFGDEVTPKLFSDELHAGDGNITLWINSPLLPMMAVWEPCGKFLYLFLNHLFTNNVISCSKSLNTFATR